MTNREWPAVLDEFADSLDRHEQVLAGELEAAEPFDPPVMATAVPPELALRAQELLDRCRRIEKDLRRAVDATRQSLLRLDHDRTATAVTAPAQPLYFDSRV